jgi:predicted RNA-binding Zn-ribbon protein involved in translation (DUF1610 family)
MIAQNTQKSSAEYAKHAQIVDVDNSVGYCLSCLSKLSRCGKPFTAEIACPKCGAVNVYEDSQQPQRLRDAA